MCIILFDSSSDSGQMSGKIIFRSDSKNEEKIDWLQVVLAGAHHGQRRHPTMLS